MKRLDKGKATCVNKTDLSEWEGYARGTGYAWKKKKIERGNMQEQRNVHE